MIRLQRLITCLFVVATLVPAAGLTAEDQAVLRADFVPAGSSTWMGWRTSIHDDGFAEQSVLNGEAWRPRRVPRISPADLQALLRLLEIVDLNRMEEIYDLSPSSDDGDETSDRLELTIRGRDDTHTVVLTTNEYAVDLLPALERHPQRKQIQEFLRIWKKTLTLVRPPNPEQSSRLYRHK